MALGSYGWNSVRFLGLIVVFVSSVAILLLWRSEPLLKIRRPQIGNGSEPWHNTSLLYKNAYQLDPPPNRPPWGAVVSAAQNDTDLSWMIFFQQNWTIFPYNVDIPHNPDGRLQIPKSKGHEAMVYLSYIVGNYDSLPWYTVFVHGHRDAWHQEDTIVRTIHDLNRAALARAGYISLRCDWFPSCPAEIRPKHHDAIVWGPGLYRNESEDAISRNWRKLFPREKMPDTVASPCCAQFAVTRQAIWRRPKADYERMRSWLLKTNLEDDISGRVLEKLWAYIFTGEAVHCPPPPLCNCAFFGRCGDEDYPHPPEGLIDWSH